MLAELCNVSIISITETSDSDIALGGYVTYRRDRVGDNHGGVCVYVNNNIFFLNVFELLNLECIWIEVIMRNKKLLIGTFYRPPNSPAATFTAIADSIGLASDTYAYDILITGDFNFENN